MKKVFTSGQVAKLCNVAPRTVSKWFDAGRLKGYRMPGSNDRRIPRENLMRFLRENGMPTAALEAEESFAVLLVGAEPRVAARLRELLPAPAFKVEAPPSLFHAGALASAVPLGAVVVDLAVGRADGVAIAERLRVAEPPARAYLAALTSEDETAPGELLAAGFDALFQKPFDVRELAVALAARHDRFAPGPDLPRAAALA
ncbi:helix-turn-helix domain-containing protein [Gemmata sp. JC717]|uniref:helix-turn-helix domain-containing protein n=1 Tax=Gemmata algarum TaxID=2975278 RepID=UPI0021BB9A55|nr:helix-turn-helix domain-containing protein [Gemmata algarum]MDY3557044.1 helix-turn-helix domain-containing protein [Gemmata algarum]